MGFKLLALSTTILFTLTSTSFALSQQALVNQLNQNSKQVIHQPNHLKEQTNAIHWTTLNGPSLGGAVQVVTTPTNPSVIFAFRRSTTGTIYKSVDNGQHFKSLTLPTKGTLRDLVALDENRLLLAAGDKIYSSNDQGEHWQAYDLNEYGYRFFVLNPNVILLEINHSYSMSNLYRSIDGGKTWSPASLGIDSGWDFWGMGGRDNLLFVGAKGLYTSTNNGALWTQPEKWQHFNLIDAIAVNSKHDVFVASSSTLYKTDPAGQTLQKINNGISGSIEKILVDSQDRLYVLANGIYQSVDNGLTWHLLTDQANIADFQILENGKIILSTHDALLLSDDSQRHYTKLPIHFSLAEVNNLFALDETHFYAIDGWIHGNLYRSDDAGKTWKLSREGRVEAITALNQQLVAMEWTSDGNSQNILVSKDNGVNWTPVHQFNSETCTTLSSDNDGIVASCYKGQLFSRDLFNWKKINEGNDHVSSGYYDGKNIYSSDGQSIKKTMDEGKTWVTLLDNLNQYGTHMTGYQNKVVLITMSGAGIIKMTNQGTTWDLINNGLTNFSFANILAVDESHYFVATDTGIFYTNDGGKNWTPENNGLDSLDVKSLSATKNILLAGTVGSGVFKGVWK